MSLGNLYIFLYNVFKQNVVVQSKMQRKATSPLNLSFNSVFFFLVESGKEPPNPTASKYERRM